MSLWEALPTVAVVGGQVWSLSIEYTHFYVKIRSHFSPLQSPRFWFIIFVWLILWIRVPENLQF